VLSELTAAYERAGVPRVSSNELRHTAATMLVDRGLLPHQVADLLGHSTTRMVDAVYRHRPPVITGAE
jgi:integrase